MKVIENIKGYRNPDVYVCLKAFRQFKARILTMLDPAMLTTVNFFLNVLYMGGEQN